MTTDELNHWAKSWIAYETSQSAEERESLWWACERTLEAHWDAPGELWQFINAVHAMDQSDRIMVMLAAGPIESLLATHGDDYIVLVEEKARSDKQFAKVLGGVWQNSMSDENWLRLQSVWDRTGWDGVPE